MTIKLLLGTAIILTTLCTTSVQATHLHSSTRGAPKPKVCVAKKEIYSIIRTLGLSAYDVLKIPYSDSYKKEAADLFSSAVGDMKKAGVGKVIYNSQDAIEISNKLPNVSVAHDDNGAQDRVNIGRDINEYAAKFISYLNRYCV